ncbi:RNA pseudouridine synthase [Actinidia chinensis var. chinensis]|uniref:RNA pseudouridine synthase n=1 Tax=Actinidia chinensis var. chinensis TaxID=1590841 RepID=A0A2R6RC22_ACTCC|nr:RNA pseudouridine synthase [Actinidia chinensis var. chinensis]
MNLGDRIFLPVTVREVPSERTECFCNEEEMGFLRSLELYKDAAIIVVNKPPGMPVQGGAGIKNSLDELAATYLRYDFSEHPRLVHRLDRDSSGILVMGRTQTSTRALHSIFREKTSGASNNDLHNIGRILQRRYWALVIGSPRRPEGLISVPLKKVIVDDGKSERITVVDNPQVMSSQLAITQYRVIESPCHGYTWLELSPLTGRKHQLRVHCAEVLGTPIVGDYKYGWQAHRKMKHLPCSNIESDLNEKFLKERRLPFGLDLDKGSILEREPHLHLHCKEMVLPNVSRALSSGRDLRGLDSVNLAAPLPPHMEKSWNFLKS